MRTVIKLRSYPKGRGHNQKIAIAIPIAVAIEKSDCDCDSDSEGLRSTSTFSRMTQFIPDRDTMCNRYFLVATKAKAMKKPMQKLSLCQPATYQINVQGRLDEHWSAWLAGMTITITKRQDAPATTTLTGVVIDQAALHGLLTKIRDLGLPLLLVRCLEPKGTANHRANDPGDISIES